jgi:hypothetical protein
MGTMLTPAQYQLYQPVNNTDINSDQLTAYIRNAKTSLLVQLPRTMQPIIDSQDFSGLPQLETFNNEYLRPWLAQIVYSDIINYSGINVEPEGSRTLTNPQSVEVSDKRRTVVAEALGRKQVAFRQRAMWEYQDKRYVFDDVAYPPTPNMGDMWNAAWLGMSYGFAGGTWGWLSGGGNSLGSIGPVAPGTRKNPRFGLNLI